MTRNSGKSKCKSSWMDSPWKNKKFSRSLSKISKTNLLAKNWRHNKISMLAKNLLIIIQVKVFGKECMFSMFLNYSIWMLLLIQILLEISCTIWLINCTPRKHFLQSQVICQIICPSRFPLLDINLVAEKLLLKFSSRNMVLKLSFLKQ